MEMEIDWIEPGQLRRLKRVEYDSLVEGGAFEDERVELVHGLLVRMSPQGPSHAEVVTRLAEALGDQLGKRVRIRQHSALALSDDSEPEPDIAVVERRSFYKGHPSTAMLVVEVSRSSLKRDRTVKAGLYAASRIPEYWVVDLQHLQVEVMREPAADGYRKRRIVKGKEILRSTLGIEIPLTSIFAPPY